MASAMALAESPHKREARALFAPLPRHYDRVAALLSFGQDPRWRATMVEAIQASPGERVLDVATGTGLVAQALVRRWGCEVVGIDQSGEMLARARERLTRDEQLAQHVTLVQGEAERLPFGEGELDHLTFTYLLRYVESPAATLAELARVVKPGGRVASLEFAVPGHRPWRELWRMYTRVGLPTLGRAVSREWAQTGRFLAESIPAFYERHPLEQVADMWREAGIEVGGVRLMSLGGGVVMWGTVRPDARGSASATQSAAAAGEGATAPGGSAAAPDESRAELPQEHAKGADGGGGRAA
jgi:demethylmenaquinone methyltransferase / 2-methoxy-6-polyprenyl-1,4-benzoquinol methylase